MLIVFEGMDHSGKSTQINILKERLKNNHNIVFARDPGGTMVSEKIRNIVLTNEMDSLTELLLFEASRAQLFTEVIKPALESNKIVIMDRFILSTYIYQGNDDNIKFIDSIHDYLLKNIKIDLLFNFKLSKEEFIKRHDLQLHLDRIESQSLDKLLKLYDKYNNHNMDFNKYVNITHNINADDSVDNISNLIWDIINDTSHYKDSDLGFTVQEKLS